MGAMAFSLDWSHEWSGSSRRLQEGPGCWTGAMSVGTMDFASFDTTKERDISW